jgi:hypothetical protein
MKKEGLILDRAVAQMVKLGLSEVLAKQFVELGQYQKVKSHYPLVELYQKCSKVFFILDGGFVNQYFDDYSESFRTVNFYVESFQPFIVVPESYFYDSPSKCQIKSVCPSELLQFSKADLNNLITGNKHFNEFYYQQLVHTLISESDLRIKLITQTPDMLYKGLLNDFPEVIQRIPSKYIAEYLGISQEWLSKLKRKI